MCKVIVCVSCVAIEPGSSKRGWSANRDMRRRGRENINGSGRRKRGEEWRKGKKGEGEEGRRYTVRERERVRIDTVSPTAAVIICFHVNCCER